MAIIKGTINNDVLLSGKEFDGLDDVILGLAGNDQIDAGLGSGGNTLGGGTGNDELDAGKNDLLLGDTGNDELDASDEGGNNSLYGGEGQDTIYAGENDKVFGGSGDDNIFAGTGNNILYGGTGRDRFWLANAEVPTSVNTVADFNAQADQMVIKLDGVNALTNLSFEQTGVDTLIKLAATGESLAILKNVDANDLNAKNVVFSENASSAATPIRVATFNASLNRNNLGQLITDLSTPNHPQAKNIAEIIQRNNPDILLLNEFDYDANGEAIALFKSNYLGVSQNGVAPVDYPYVYLAPSNTGVDSGLDLDKNGVLGEGNDAFGFGTFPGQYGMVVLSKYPLISDQVRTFQNFLWKDMPGNLLTNDPTENPLSGENGYYSPEAVEILRLSSKSHWDIPINVNGEIVHVLAAHPTPPVFDGAEDRNGKRNYDEIRFWSDYVTPGKSDYAYDDQGNKGGLKAGERFVILGDYNADPFDGDSYQGAANQFFNTPAIAGSTTDNSITPTSDGATEASQIQGGINAQHKGNPSFDTGDFADTSPGNIRIDYVLPSTNLTIEDGGVFWPKKSDPLFGIVGEYDPTLDPNIYPARTPSSDHHLVYNDLTIPMKANTQARKTVTGVENLGLVTFSTDTSFKETQLGGLSGIVYDQAQNSYYAISDDRSSINPARFYTLEINLSDGRLDSGDVSFTQVTTLLDSQGNPFSTDSLDTEGIALTENGSVYIASEGEARPDIPRLTNPFVNQFSLSGQQLSELPVAEKYFPNQTVTTGIRNNLAFESLTMTPDGRYLYTATENAIAQDGSAATLTDTSLSRIVKYDLTTRQVVAEYVYEVEKVGNNPIPDGSFATNGLVELLAIDNNGTLLALERGFSTGVGNTVKLYQIQTQGALDVSSFDGLFWETENTRFAIDSPVKKKLLVDFQSDLGIIPDNLEGLSLGPVLADGRQSLIVVSDNNFSATQTTQFIALGLDIQTTPAVLPVTETPDVIDDANGETTTLGLLGDADDPAVWIDPDNAEDSLIIGTLKDGGLAVFSLDGEVLQKITPTDILGATADFGDLRYNNVDVLYNFQLGTETIDIAVVSDRANDTINIFKINPETHQLESITAPTLLDEAFSIFGVDDGEITAYGLGGYKSPVTGKFYVFVTEAGGNNIAQLELQSTESGTITASVVRTIELPITAGDEAADYQSEAIAVDQEKGIVYLAVENKIGIVKFAAEPNGGNTITVVRPVDSPELVPDLEGLAIYYGPNGTGYLVASSQGDSSYAVYSREGSNSYLGSFVVGDNLPAGIDQANETDGLEIINVPLGPTFPFGALLVQDGANNPQNAVENGDELENNNTNFKFVRWDDVANAFEIPLTIDPTSYNPRNSGVNPTPELPISLTAIGTYATGQYNQSAAEIPAFDPVTKRLFVVNAQKGKVDVLDASNPTNPTLITSIDTTAFGFPNSVAIKDGLVAIAVENIDKQAKGQVLFYSTNSQDFATPLKALEVGALPDMLTFSPDGKKVLVANEGEPNGDYTIDPEGSVSFIDLSLGVEAATVKTADFTAFNSQFAQLKAVGVKFKEDVGTTRTVAQDLEPEYIAFSADGTKAWVTLQEANAIAVVDIATATVESIKPLGFKDYSQPNNALDASDRDNVINIRNWPVLGMYQPDAIASYAANGQTYYITANEGDSRDYDGYSEEARIQDLILDPTAFPNAAELQEDENIGRLLVTTALGDTDGDGDYDQLYSYGGRSFSIWNSEGQLVYDSGNNLERITAELFPDHFNASNSNNNFDNRSDDKGPEPEGVVTGVINGRTYAFIGLERIGGVMVYDVTDPVSPDFVQYINNRDFTAATNSAAAKDLGPEGLAFISAQDSPNGKPLLVVANEVSGTTTFYEIDVNTLPVNNPPTAVILSNTVTQLAENTNTTGGIKVANITITDDGQGTNILSLSGADATSFEIRGNELFFIGNSPDFETKTKYDVTVNVDDISVGETPDASTDFTLNITNLPDENISDRITQFNNKGDNRGSLVYNLSDVSGNANTQADDTALEQTDALFHNLIGLYQVENANGAILDTLDLNGNGAIDDLLNPADTGYARTAITNAVNNFVLQIGANGNPTDNTSGSEFGDVLLQGGKRYSPFAIANGGNLIPTGGTLQDGINNFLDQNPNNIAADLSNFMNHAVAYFSFGMANPDGTEHLQNRGNNVFGFEDLPGNLGISDFDFNDAVFKFTFIG